MLVRKEGKVQPPLQGLDQSLPLSIILELVSGFMALLAPYPKRQRILTVHRAEALYAGRLEQRLKY